MSSEKQKLTPKGLIGRILEPNPKINDISSRQQARFTTIVSIIVAVVSFIGGIIGVFGRFPASLVAGLFILTVTTAIAVAFGHTKNFMVGSTFLVGGLILGGFFIAAVFSEITVKIIILLAAIIPAFALSLVLLPFLTIIIIAVIILISIGVLPLTTSISSGKELTLFLGLALVEGVFVLIAWFREKTNILQQDEIGSLRDGLEERVEERTRYTRLAADIAQEIITSPTIEQLLGQTANLTAARFGFSYVGVFLADETGHYLELRAANGSEMERLIRAGKRIMFGPPSLLGWVAENKQLRLVTRITEDPLQLEPEFLAGNQSELGIPILGGDNLLGVMDMQSTQSTSFDNETIVVLQMLASQVAIAINNIRLPQVKQGGFQEVIDTYLAGFKINRAATENEVYQTIQELFSKTPYIAMLLTPSGEWLKVIAKSDSRPQEGQSLPELISVGISDLEPFLTTGIFIGEENRLNSLPNNLASILRQLLIFSAALIPISRNGTISDVLIIATREQNPLVQLALQPYIDLVIQMGATLDRIQETKEKEDRLKEDEAIILINQEITTVRDLPELFAKLHNHIRETMGNLNFLVALYDNKTNSISIPYLFEKGTDKDDAVNHIEPFPVGEGLTSILIRTKQPLMLVKDTEQRATALGAKIAGKPAKSWLGTPLLVADEVIGAIIVQDVENELAFNDNDLRFVSALSTQVAGVINNAHLLEETRNRAIQLQTAAEIARDISGSLDLGELLNKAVMLIRERFNFYHAAIFLIDSTHEFAIIREATGEAGLQMKRAGHKLKVGSKSIVGYVTGSGEPLIVNDTNRDATYYANPLLPETRAEAALPLKVGQRILGAIDVQSTQPFSFGDENIRVLRILSDQMAIAVINSELFADTQEHLSQHRLLHHVTTAAASGTTLEEALNSAVQGLQVTLGGDRVSILLADRASKTLRINSFAGYSEEVGQLSIPFGEGITGWVAVHLQPQRINDVSQDSRYIQVGSNVRSELAVPLSYRGELLGVLNVESDQAGAYNENDEEMLGTLGGSLAAIISNARLIEQVRRQVDHERMLYEVTSKIRRSTDMHTIMATTTSELSKVLGARRAQIKLEIEDEPKTESKAGSE